MLLIHCPYCNVERPELEFAYAGEAHIARPTDPSQLDRRRLARPPLHPLQSARRCISSAGVTSMAAARFFNAARDTVSDKFVTTYKAGPAPPARSTARRGSPVTNHRIAGKGRVDRNRPVRFTFNGDSYEGFRATRWRRPCWRTASIWSAARSSITARAASCRPARKSPTRWSA